MKTKPVVTKLENIVLFDRASDPLCKTCRKHESCAILRPRENRCTGYDEGEPFSFRSE